MNDVDKEIAEGLKTAFKDVPVDTTGAPFQNMTVNGTPKVDMAEAKVETKSETSVEAKVETPEVKSPESSLKTETPKEEIKKEIEVPVQKSFEELFAEQTGGKFKSWKEVEDILNTPKEELDPEIKHLAELKKQGIKFDQEFWKIQTKDYESMQDPIQIRLEAMSLNPDYKGWSEEEMRLELKELYRVKEWSEDGEEPTEIEKLMTKKLERDAEKDLEALINKKKSYTTIKNPDEAVIKEQARLAQERQKSLEKYIDEELFGKVSKLSTLIDEKNKESFEFELPEADRKETANMMKLMGTDVSVFWNQFKDEKGDFDYKQFYEMLLWNKNRNNIVKLIHQNSLAKGREAEVKEIKNIDFKADSKGAPKGEDWRDKAIKQVEKHL